MPLPPAPKNVLARAWVTLQLLRHLPRTARLVADASRGLALGLVAVVLVASLVPAATAWVGKRIVDGVVTAAASGAESDRAQVLAWIGAEMGLMGLSLALARSQQVLRDTLSALLSNTASTKILQKALTLELRHFEDAELYDTMQRARVEGPGRALSMVMQVATLGQGLLTLTSFAVLLSRLSWWSGLVIAAAALPAFIAEARLGGDLFRVTSARAPDLRRQGYLELLLTRNEAVQEVKLFELGPLFVARYRALADRFYSEDRRLALRRTLWGAALGSLSLLAFYACYLVMARQAALSTITLGDLTLYLTVFRQGQDTFQSILGTVSGLYLDGLYMSNLFAFLDVPTTGEAPRQRPPRRAAAGPQAIELRDVSFRYPGHPGWALRHIDLVIPAGQTLAICGDVGAGKTTLIKLLLRLYDPTEGALLYGGVDLRDMDVRDLRDRVGVLFQDFSRYQMTVAENVGVGSVQHLADRSRIERAIERGGAAPWVNALPGGLDTMLGGWFEEGRELSGGQWQALALARAFMRHAEILILDEPTSALDPEAESRLAARLRELAANRSAIVISHRLSTARAADRIAVFGDGMLLEQGTHQELLAREGRYARLFRLQSASYREAR